MRSARAERQGPAPEQNGQPLDGLSYRGSPIREQKTENREQGDLASVLCSLISVLWLAPLHHQLLDLADRLRRVQSLGAGLGAVHDGVAAIEPERVFQVVEPVAGCLVARIRDPAIGLQQDGGAKIAVAVPPVARARGRAAEAQDAFPQAVEPGALLRRLRALAGRGGGVRLQP